MSTVKTESVQHTDSAIANIALAADGTVAFSPTQNTQTGTTYTFVLADAGKIVTASNASAQTYTVPLQSSVAWGAGTKLDVLNLGAGTVTIAAAAGVTISGTPLTLATSKGGSLIRTASDAWTFIPLSSGVSNANFTDTATGTYSDSGVNYKYLTFTSSGTVTIDRAGFADVLIVGAGSGGGSSNISGYEAGGGGAGQVFENNVYLTAATFNVIVGAGGAGGVSTGSFNGDTGFPSSLGSFLASGGGGGGSRSETGRNGASGGGGGTTFAGGSAFSSLTGNDGAAGTSNSVGGGGGGSGAAGSGVTGGAGTSSSINNSATTYGAGGNAGGNANGAANTGNGGEGSTTNGVAGGSGGSGIVIIRVVV